MLNFRYSVTDSSNRIFLIRGPPVFFGKSRYRVFAKENSYVARTLFHYLSSPQLGIRTPYSSAGWSGRACHLDIDSRNRSCKDLQWIVLLRYGTVRYGTVRYATLRGSAHSPNQPAPKKNFPYSPYRPAPKKNSPSFPYQPNLKKIPFFMHEK
jgi:hypothetical protein